MIYLFLSAYSSVRRMLSTRLAALWPMSTACNDLGMGRTRWRPYSVVYRASCAERIRSFRNSVELGSLYHELGITINYDIISIPFLLYSTFRKLPSMLIPAARLLLENFRKPENRTQKNQSLERKNQDAKKHRKTRISSHLLLDEGIC